MGKNVGNYLKQLRKKRGLSQGDVAKLLSLKTAQSISNIERGVSPLPRTKIKRIADVLGVRKNELVTLVMSEVHDKYSKVTGVPSRTLVVSYNLTSEDCTLLQSLADKMRHAKNLEKNQIRKKVEKIL